MWPTNQAFDADALRRTVDDYRDRVYNGPADMRARIDLAWYLFLLAVHEAGREGRAEPATADPDLPPKLSTDIAPPLGLASRALLKESARQAAIVAQLSSDPQTRGQAANLKQIARTVNAAWAVREAESEAAHVLADLSRAVLSHNAVPGGRAKQPQ